MYFSAAQLATVGTSQISPETDVLRAVSIMETITGLGLITLILTFLFGVYQVVHDLRALAANFDTAEHGLDHPLASLGPYFAQSELSCLDNELRSISANFWSYTDGLRQHPLAYYFQSGKDQFSLPYVLHMLSEWIAALRWGLPSEHPITVQPRGHAAGLSVRAIRRPFASSTWLDRHGCFQTSCLMNASWRPTTRGRRYRTNGSAAFCCWTVTCRNWRGAIIRTNHARYISVTNYGCHSPGEPTKRPPQ